MSRTINSSNVIVYVDGFNLYFGLKSKRWKRFYWLDLERLAQNLLRPGQKLLAVKYFTARISSPHSKKSRQDTYLDALRTRPLISIFEGHYQPKPFECGKCRTRTDVPIEKMTDVNIACELLVDAYNERFDTAFLISGDSDLVPPVRHLHTAFPTKSLVVIFPPNRVSNELRGIANAAMYLGKGPLKKSQFADEITRPSGIPLRRPDYWR